MRIIVAGGTGFVGKNLVRGLLEDGHQLQMIVRPGSEAKAPKSEPITIVPVDPSEPVPPASLHGHALINLVGIIREFPSKGITFRKAHYEVTKNLVDFAGKAGVRRFLQMSALGVKRTGKTAYQQTKFQAERYVMESGLEWTIFRPSVIFGPGDNFVNMLAKMIRMLPVVPVTGDGKYKLQPVHVDDVCLGFRKALGDDRSVGKTFEFGGPETMTFDEILDRIGKALGISPVRKLHQPIWTTRIAAALLGRFPWFPVTNSQITMLLEDCATEDKSFFEHFSIAPTEFSQGIRGYLKRKGT